MERIHHRGAAAAAALPAVPFQTSTWSYKRKVNKNAHVVWARNLYFVPFSQVGVLVNLRVTDTMLEVYRNDERLTSHLLLPGTTSNKYQTNEADLPEGRIKYSIDQGCDPMHPGK